jgi:hypothetical protein
MHSCNGLLGLMGHGQPCMLGQIQQAPVGMVPLYFTMRACERMPVMVWSADFWIIHDGDCSSYL